MSRVRMLWSDESPLLDTGDRIRHALTEHETTLWIGACRIPIAIDDETAVQEGLLIAARLNIHLTAWRNTLEARYERLRQEREAREHATPEPPVTPAPAEGPVVPDVLVAAGDPTPTREFPRAATINDPDEELDAKVDELTKVWAAFAPDAEEER